MKKLVTDLDVRGKRVLLRVDFNVPIQNGQIVSDIRILSAIPTIKHLTDNGAKVIICSHLGRPDGKNNKQFSLKPVADYLGKILTEKVFFAKDTIGEDAVKKAEKLKEGQILVLENTRFNDGEKDNDAAFIKGLASLADLYVDDAFGTSHRKESSTYGVAKLLPNAIGFLIAKELDYFNKALLEPERPFVAILGGAKIEDKLGVINNLLDKVDALIIGGGMSYTFSKAMGGKIGKSIVDNNQVDYCYNVIKKALNSGVKILLPVDDVCALSMDSKEKPKVFASGQISDEYMGLDIGPKTVKLFSKEIKRAKTIMWNGPMGVFEEAFYSNGTKMIAKAVATSKAFSIVGGGDTASAVEQYGYSESVSHISTGGGASLMLLEGKELPAVSVIDNK
ncbi:MAG: phosphoglycerate kinase [Spirochaetales bacterium]